MSSDSSASASASSHHYHVQFEVHGHVQRVFFRKYTQSQADSLGLQGWCRNTSEGTVKGEIFTSNASSLAAMKQWLSETGSPKSRIDKLDWNEKRLEHLHEIEPLKSKYQGTFQIVKP
jgi:acylphosphatase